MIDKMVIKNCKKTNLSVDWIDYKETYGMFLILDSAVPQNL